MKEKLIEYCNIKKEIKDLEDRIDKINKQSDMVADLVQNGYKRRLVIEGYDKNRLDKLNRYKDKLQLFYDKLLEVQTEAEEYIENIEESRMRSILRYRYIDDLNLVEIALKLSKNKSPDSIRKEIDRFFDKI